MKKTVTEKKLAANRLNSKRSTGPRTERGKNASKFNAVITGLFAKHVVIPLFDDNGGAFWALLHSLRQEFQPEAPFEIFCVAQIAEGMWSLRRKTFAEKGLIKKAAESEGKPPEPVLLAETHLADNAILKKARKEIKTTGSLSPEGYRAVCPILSRHHIDTAQSTIDASIKKCVQITDDWIEASFAVGKMKREDYFARHALPPEPAMNLTHRYERAAQKKIDWALEKLLESQQRRQKAQAQ